jgi:alanine racemase
VDLGAIRHNVELVRAAVAPSAVWAVVKADAYGHGAVSVARAALEAGVEGLCVALAQEGEELRAAGIDAPILLLSEQPPNQSDDIVANRLTPTVYSLAAIDAIATAARGRDPIGVHLKIDTGMNRAGAAATDAIALADAIVRRPEVRLDGVFTHLAMADEPDAASNSLQMQRFDAALDALRGAGHDGFRVHAANSAGGLAHPRARLDFVRLGIAMYGIQPGPGVTCDRLRPALSLHARVTRVALVPAGEGVSYGLRHRFDRDATVATVPLGYADGVPRRLFETGGEVIVHGRRAPIVGVVTMDQLMIDCGDMPVAVGDEVTLIGSQDGANGEVVRVTAEEWADRLGTIGYEIVCGISKRIERRHRTAP